MPGRKKRLKWLEKQAEIAIGKMIRIENVRDRQGVLITTAYERIEALDDKMDNYVPNPAYVQSLEKRIEALEDDSGALDRRTVTTEFRTLDPDGNPGSHWVARTDSGGLGYGDTELDAVINMAAGLDSLVYVMRKKLRERDDE